MGCECFFSVAQFRLATAKQQQSVKLICHQSLNCVNQADYLRFPCRRAEENTGVFKAQDNAAHNELLPGRSLQILKFLAREVTKVT